MYENTIDYLKKLDCFNLELKKINEKLFVLESKKYNFAFDIVSHENSISIDFVYRPGTLDKKFIEIKYKNLINNKCRIFTALQEANPHVFFDIIKSEFLELVYLYNENKSNKQYYIDINNKLVKEEPLKFWFFDGFPNFGDFMTPWLANHLTKKPVVNVRSLPSSNGAILGVGSIVQYISPNHRDIKVWGSGLISSENHHNLAKKLHKMNVQHVYASRGELTRSFFEKYNFSCSKVLGDPGLLFGRLYTPRTNKKYKFAIIPHYIHYQFFKDLQIEDCIIVDVRKELTTVIDQISNADACISTSLHGLIISQTYGIPWVHLYINDGRLLVGEEFKFHDFFSILEAKNIQQYVLSLKDLNKASILNLLSKANLPVYKSNYSYDALLDSFHESIDQKKNVLKRSIKEEEKLEIILLSGIDLSVIQNGIKYDLYKPFEIKNVNIFGFSNELENSAEYMNFTIQKLVNLISKESKKSEILIELSSIYLHIVKIFSKQHFSLQQDHFLAIFKQKIYELKKLGYSINILSCRDVNTIDSESYKDLSNLKNLIEKMCFELEIKHLDDSDGNCNIEEFRKCFLVSDIINNFYQKKFNIKINNLSVKSKQNSFVKRSTLKADQLSDDMKINIQKGDVFKVNEYYRDNLHIYANAIHSKEKIYTGNWIFYLPHFSLID